MGGEGESGCRERHGARCDTPRPDRQAAVLSGIARVPNSDLPEHQRAEDELRASEARLRLALDASSAGSWSWNAVTGESTWDDRFHALYGFGPDDPRTQAAWLAALDSEDRPGVMRRIQQMLDTPGDDTWAMEYRSVHPGLGRRWHQGLGRAERDAAGKIRWVTGIDLDITSRKVAEEALKRGHDELEHTVQQRTAELSEAARRLQREAEGRLRTESLLEAFFDASTGIVSICDDELRFLMTDRVTPSYFGLDSASIRGKSLAELMPQYVEHYGPMIRRVMETGEPLYDVEVSSPLPSRGGEAAYWRFSYFAVPLPNGKRGCGVVGVEVTERKRAEDALRQSHDELKAIYDGLKDGLLVADLQTRRFVRANKAICRMLGYTEREILGLSVADIHPADTLPAIDRRFRQYELGQYALASDVPVMRKDGTIFGADIASNPLNYQGRRCRIGIFRDITERKHAQEALERERKTLEHLLQSSDHERQLIAYDIHDGLAQQLAAAMMQFQAYGHLKATAPADAQTAFDLGSALLRQAHGEARRLISGVRPPILDEEGVVAAIIHLVNERAAAAREPKIDVASRVHFTRLVPALENAIYRIVQEALSNACLHSKSQRVRITLSQRKQRLQIEIRDWGVGFDPDIPRDNRYGLEGMRERARLLGGKLEITSVPGQGTTILVEVPIVERESESEPAGEA